MLNPVLTRRPSLSTKKVIPVCPPETWRKAAALVIAKTWRAATISGAPGTGFRKIFVPTVSKKVMTNIRTGLFQVSGLNSIGNAEEME